MNLLPFALLPGLTAAICAAHDAIQDGVEFLRAHMPAQDRGTVTQERLVREVRLALAARSQFPWAAQVPWELYENNVLPYAVVNEPRDEWREQFHHLFAPLVSPCKTGREAALAIASLIQKTLNVRYSTERRVPHQGAKESLQSGKVSCTGQSILLICALRSVGIPARMAGVLTWNHVRGNHNWVEAWCDGEWKMLEYNEKDFNTPWVMSAISMLDPRKPENAIYATSWKKEPSGAFFPMIWGHSSAVKLRFLPGAILAAIMAASIGKVPLPQKGSTRIRSFFQGVKRISAEASVSVIGAGAVIWR